MKNQQWGANTLSYWLVLLLAISAILLGLRFIFSPHAASVTLGVPLPEGNLLIYGGVKGIRDIFGGLILLYSLLRLKSLRITSVIFTLLIMMPAFDFILVLSTNGINDWSHLLPHGGTTLFMVFVSILLFRDKALYIN